MLQAKLFGQCDIRINDLALRIPSRPIQSVFAFFLLHPHVPFRREQLAGRFWSDSTESNARSNLRHALWLIRKAIGGDSAAYFECDDRIIAFHPLPGDQIDVEIFKTCSDTEPSIDILLEALSLYQGELLPGFYEEWVVLEREVLQASFERKMGKALELMLAEKRWQDVLAWGERWIAMGTIPEPAYRALMLAQAGLGNLAAAAAQYQRCVESMHRAMGVEPSEETRLTFLHLQDRGIKRDSPKKHPPASIQHVLPAYFKKLEKQPPIFVGCNMEFSELDSHLQKALKGQSQVVFISGEAGSGKSSLIYEFIRRSISSCPELVVGLGTCNALFGQGVPYLPFRDVLNTLSGGVDALYANSIVNDEQAIQLISAFPIVIQTLIEHGPVLIKNFLNRTLLVERMSAIWSEEPYSQELIQNLSLIQSSLMESDKSQLFDQYTQVMNKISTKRPLLIALDDLQWADAGTCQMLFHLFRCLPNTRILYVGAFRREEISNDQDGHRHPLESLMNEFQSSLGKITIDLDHNREKTGRKFIDAYLDSEPNRLNLDFRRELFQHTHGHPLFTVQLLRNFQERGEIYKDGRGLWVTHDPLNWDNLPAQVDGVIAERIGRLDRNLQDLLFTASVEGEQFTVQVLADVLKVEESEILRQLSRILEKQHRLVQEVGEFIVGSRRLTRFRFVHTLIHSYLYHQIGTSERAVFHQRIAETIESLNCEDTAAVAVQLARHFHEAGNMPKAIEYLQMAGDQARTLYANQEAIHYYQQALNYLRKQGSADQVARTLMKLYLVYHSSFDFDRAQQALEECTELWDRIAKSNSHTSLPSANNPYRLSALKAPILDPGLDDNFFDFELIKELFCGLVQWSEDRYVIPSAAKHWEVLENGRRYIFHLRDDLFWSDGNQVTADDFEYALKRVLDPTTNGYLANLLFDIRGAKEFNQGLVNNPSEIGIFVRDPFTLEIELEKPCGYFLYLLGDPVTFAVPKHVVEREGINWTTPGRIVTNGPFLPVSAEPNSEKTIHFVRNPYFPDGYQGNIEQVTVSTFANELDAFHAFQSGRLDMVEFLVPQFQAGELEYYRKGGQLHTSSIPFVDAIYFISDKSPFNDMEIRRAFVLATDREKLAREVENQLPAMGGYIPPGLPGHSRNIGLPYDPQTAQRILAKAGYPHGRGFPPLGLLLGLVGLKKGDKLVFDSLKKMWWENLGVVIKDCWNRTERIDFDNCGDFNLFFVGWLADYPDPASFLESNFLINQCHWKDKDFDKNIEKGRNTLDQSIRVQYYQQADEILINQAVVLPLFYGNIYELRQPWVQRLGGSSIYNPQWKDLVIRPH